MGSDTVKQSCNSVLPESVCDSTKMAVIIEIDNKQAYKARYFTISL